MKTKQAAMEAARKKLGAAANEGIDFTCRNTGAGWTWEEIQAGNAAAAKAKAKRAPKPTKHQKAVAQAQAKTAAVVKDMVPKVYKTAAQPKGAPAEGTKSAALVALLKRPAGATSAEMEQATGWKAASVRGLLGTMRANGVTIESKKLGKGEPTVYKLHETKTAATPDVGDVI